MKIVVCLVFLGTVYHSHCASLPDYIKPCKKSDPDLKKCALEHGLAAYDSVVKGDRKHKIPNLSPLNLPLVDIDAGPNLKLSFQDLVVDGLQTSKISAIDFDLEKMHFEFKIQMPRVNFLGKYKVDGKILVLPIVGNGNANITFVDGDYVYTFNWIMINKDGKDYAQLINPTFDFKLGNAYFHLDNLFNGDKALGDQMNKFLNENWQDVVKDIGVGIGDTIKTIANEIFSNYISKVPFNEVFVD